MPPMALPELVIVALTLRFLIVAFCVYPKRPSREELVEGITYVMVLLFPSKVPLKV